MTVPADLAALQWALSYPFARPSGDFVFLDGAAHPLVMTADQPIGEWTSGGVAVRDCVGSDRAEALAAGDLRPVWAVGSNASPVQLRRKFAHRLDDIVILAVTLTARDVVVGFARHIAPYASIPATAISARGARTPLTLLWLDAAAFDVIHASERADDAYEAEPVTLDVGISALDGVPAPVAYFAKAGAMSTPWIADNPTKHQWDAQAEAIARLGLTRDVKGFILDNLADPDRRRARDAALRAT